MKNYMLRYNKLTCYTVTYFLTYYLTYILGLQVNPKSSPFPEYKVSTTEIATEPTAYAPTTAQIIDPAIPPTDSDLAHSCLVI